MNEFQEAAGQVTSPVAGGADTAGDPADAALSGGQGGPARV